MATKDGYEWTAAQGLKAGLPCRGAVDASRPSSIPTDYDIIVVGAGFAGLIASRDLSLQGTLQPKIFSSFLCSTIAQVSKFCSWKLETVLEGEHGRRSSMDIASRWVQHGSFGTNPMFSARLVGTA